MREVVFLKKNEKKWKQVENIVSDHEQVDPDRMAELFIELNDDLSYAKTNYPESNTTEYLNGITSSIYQTIYQNRKEKSNRFLEFWKKELPLAVGRAHPQFLYSFLFFTCCVLIGVISTAYDDNFPRIILGDGYVEMTLENIEKGDPLAVYKDENQTSMFLAITLNNLRVSLWTFICGIFLSFGSYWFLFKNGVMLGAFQWFFYKKGLLWTSFLTIWIHGTIEISCIVIAGAAGIILGNSFMFPGTHKRIKSFQQGARRATKVFIGIVPLIILAGSLEGFVTRYTEHHWTIRLGIIITSLAFIIYYFILLPRKLLKQEGEKVL